MCMRVPVLLRSPTTPHVCSLKNSRGVKTLSHNNPASSFSNSKPWLLTLRLFRRLRCRPPRRLTMPRLRRTRRGAGNGSRPRTRFRRNGRRRPVGGGGRPRSTNWHPRAVPAAFPRSCAASAAPQVLSPSTSIAASLYTPIAAHIHSRCRRACRSGRRDRRWRRRSYGRWNNGAQRLLIPILAKRDRERRRTAVALSHGNGIRRAKVFVPRRVGHP